MEQWVDCLCFSFVFLSMVKLRKRGDTLPLFLYKLEGLHTHTHNALTGWGIVWGKRTNRHWVRCEKSYNRGSGMIQCWKVEAGGCTGRWKMVVWGFGRELCDSLFIWPVTEQLCSICVHKTAAFLSASMPPFPKIQALYTETVPNRFWNF